MKRLFAAIETVAAFFLLAVALLTAGNVLLRSVLATQLPDWFDGARMLQGIALFWGFALATYYGSHICVDVLWEHVAERGKRAIDLVATLITLSFLAPLAWMVWSKVLGTGSEATADLRVPLAWFYAVAAVGAVVAALLAAVRLGVQLAGRDQLLQREDQQ